MSWTPQQEDVFRTVAHSPGHASVEAVAGSGKTSTILHAAQFAGPNCGFMAFNKSIADELRGRLDGAGRAVTMHSLGFKTLLDAFPDMAREPDAAKTSKLFRERCPELHEEGRGRWKGKWFPKKDYVAVTDAVGIAKRQLLDPLAERQTLIAACDSQGLELPDLQELERWVKAVAQVHVESLEDTSSCDFDDMLSQPLFHELLGVTFGTLFLDEAQDLNPCQHDFALQLAERYVVVGDPRQAIYGFAGADCGSFDTLAHELSAHTTGCTHLPLTCSFRCPRSHGELATLLVPHFTVRPDAPEGEVADLDTAQAVELMAPGDLVVCRANAPLLSLAYRLIQANRPVLVRGRGIGDGLQTLVRKLGRDGDLEELEDRLDSWEERKLTRLRKRDAAQSAVQQVLDQAACLRHLIASVTTLDELVARIDTLFADANPDNAILLSSVHRAKGLERDRVFIWEPGLMPCDEDLQERNLLYVALTRAKQSLWLVDDKVHRKHGYRTWVERVAAGFSRRDLVQR